MIFSENRFPLFGIMLEGGGRRDRPRKAIDAGASWNDKGLPAGTGKSIHGNELSRSFRVPAAWGAERGTKSFHVCPDEMGETGGNWVRSANSP
jgi:hypothetical protein